VNTSFYLNLLGFESLLSNSSRFAFRQEISFFGQQSLDNTGILVSQGDSGDIFSTSAA
jgi:hypothetical protein